MGLTVSRRIKTKLLEKHNVKIHEINECFSNRTGNFLKDTRENHATDPPTLWFVSETDYGRQLKVVFIHDENTNDFIIKTAYEANDDEKRIYRKHAQ